MGWLSERRAALKEKILRLSADGPEAASAVVEKQGGTPGPAGDGSSASGADAIAKWVAGGFILASGVLTFIGAEGGELDRIMRDNPVQAVAVFVLIGVAVAGGVVAPAVSDLVRVPLGVVVVVVGIAVAIGILWLHPGRTLAVGNASLIAVAIGMLLLIAAYLVWDTGASLKLSVIFLSVVLFALGMFGAFSVAVEAKTAKDRPNISLAFEGDDSSPTLQVTVKAAGLRTDEHIALTVRGFGSRLSNREDIPARFECGDRCVLLHAYRVGGDSAGVVDKAIDLPITVGDFSRFEVQGFVCSGDRLSADDRSPVQDGCKPTRRKTAYLDVRAPIGPDRPSLALAWKERTATSLEAELTASAASVGGSGVVTVNVYGRESAVEPYRLVGRFDVAPTRAGSADELIPIALKPTTQSLCATATLVRPGVTPPVDCTPGPATSMLEVEVLPATQ